MQEGRTQKTVKNAFFAFLNQALSIIISFVNRTIFIQVLGSSYLGISGLFSDILMMLSLADLGLISAMAFSYYKPLATGDEKKVAALLRFYRKIYLGLAVVVSIVGVSLIPFLKYIVNLDHELPYLNVYYLFFLGNTVVSYLFVYKSTLITADQKQYLVSKYTTIISLARMVIQIIVLMVFKSYFGYLIINILATLGTNMVLSIKANKLYPFIRHCKTELEKSERKSIFENIKSVFIYKTSAVVMNGTDNTLISILIGTVWVGIYSNYNMIISAINTFINLVYSSSTASIGNIVAKENSERRFEAFRMIQTVSLLLTTFTTICLSLLLNDLIFVWLGETYTLDIWTTVAILVNFYIVGIVHPIWTFREATGLFRKTKYIMLISAIINIALSLLLGYWFGIAGILFASAISRLSTYFWYEPKLLFKGYFEKPEREYYFPMIKNLCIVIVSIAVLGYPLSFIPVTNWGLLIIKTIIVGLLSLFISIIFYRKTEGFVMLKQRAMGLLHYRKTKGD